MDCDRISELPDALLAHILSYLPIYVTIKTSVLSKRWKNLWLNVTGLELNDDFSPHVEDLSQVMDRILEFNQGLSLKKLKVYLRNLRSHRFARLKEWIATLTDRGIEHLDVQIRHQFLVVMPMNVFKSKTLVSLKLYKVGFDETQELVTSLPCLKIMKLDYIDYQNLGPLFLEKLISSCPLLEDLTLDQYNFHEYMPFLSVRSQTLKIFHLISDCSKYKNGFSVEIDAPGLEFIVFIGRQCDKIVVKNLSSSVKMHLHFAFNPGFAGIRASETENLRNIEDFLISISSVRHMIISLFTMQQVFYPYSKHRQIPKFHHLSHLEASFSGFSLEFLPVFLENCPNLKHLILNILVISQQVDLTNGNVPQCLTSTLEYVKITSLDLHKEAGIQLVNYFLVNSAILKKLFLNFTNQHSMLSNNDLDIIMKLFASTKLSKKCKLTVARSSCV